VQGVDGCAMLTAAAADASLVVIITIIIAIRFLLARPNDGRREKRAMLAWR